MIARTPQWLIQISFKDTGGGLTFTGPPLSTRDGRTDYYYYRRWRHVEFRWTWQSIFNCRQVADLLASRETAGTWSIHITCRSMCWLMSMNFVGVSRQRGEYLHSICRLGCFSFMCGGNTIKALFLRPTNPPATGQSMGNGLDQRPSRIDAAKAAKKVRVLSFPKDKPRQDKTYCQSE